jgi:hypothetical protein
MAADVAGPVEYARTADSASIDYQGFGDGRPVLRLAPLGVPSRASSVTGPRSAQWVWANAVGPSSGAVMMTKGR